MKKLVTRIAFTALLIVACTSAPMVANTPTHLFGGGVSPVPPDCWPGTPGCN